MSDRLLIVTHHSPDLDAVSAVWLLKRFYSQKYADAKVAFVDPGEKISLEEAEKKGCQLHEVVHVDTGLEEFDHHQPEKALNIDVTASSLVYDHICQVHPELKNDETLKEMIKFINQVDHFREAYWPEADSSRYVFMITQLIEGCEFNTPHDDDSQLHFAMQCLDNAYASMEQYLKAKEAIKDKGIIFTVKNIKCLGLATRNSVSVKLAQKQGYQLVIRKDPQDGYLRINVSPNCELTLDKLYEKIKQVDHKGHWFFHGSHKMLLNGSNKDLKKRQPSPLTLEQVIDFVKEIYG